MMLPKKLKFGHKTKKGLDFFLLFFHIEPWKHDHSFAEMLKLRYFSFEQSFAILVMSYFRIMKDHKFH